MKRITIIFITLLFFASPHLSSACNKGTFTEIRGQRNIELGKVFEYSVKIKGQVEHSRWKVLGGQLQDEWYKGDTYYARVRWDTMDANNPSHIEVVGEDDCRMHRSESLYVTRVNGSVTQQPNGGERCGSFGKIQGPETVVFGEIYTYSTVVNGSFEQGGWSATGGDVVNDWWDGNTYYAQVKWKTNNPKDPSELKIWGDDVCGNKHVNQKLYITRSRGGSGSGGGFGPPQSTNGVTLYSEKNYQGFSRTFAGDVQNLGNTDMGDDRARSLRLGPGCEAILYRKSQYQGEWDVFTQDSPNLNDTRVGKSASSLRVRCD